MNNHPVGSLDKDLADASESPTAPRFWRTMPRKQFKVSESRWGVFVVSLAVLGMLGAFYSVVRGATTAGELRRQGTATQAATVARCQALRNGPIRTHCLNALPDPIPATSPAVVAAR